MTDLSPAMNTALEAPDRQDAPRRRHPLREIFSTNRWPILATQGLTVTEETLELLHPAAIGWAVNDLLHGRYVGLSVFAGLYLTHVGVAVLRQRHDSRTYHRIYSDLAVKVIDEQRRRGVAAPQLMARSVLARQFTTFFERDVPSVIAALFGFFGALAMLFAYDWVTGAAAAALVLPLILISRWQGRQTITYSTRLNDRLEREGRAILDGRPTKLRRHYRSVMGWRVRLSDVEATSWGWMQVLMAALGIIVLVRATGLPGAEAGTIFAIVAYYWNFTMAFDDVPELVEQAGQLRDIGRRLDGSHDAAAEDDD